MSEEQRIPSYLKRLGLQAADIDVVFIGHLHFDHAGGLGELKRCGCAAEVHVQQNELDAAMTGKEVACFHEDFIGHGPLLVKQGEYDLTAGVRAITTLGHTAGHMSVWVELPKGLPVLLASDAADLMENLLDEVAPGACWQDQYAEAVGSIRKLKQIAQSENAVIWPNHDFAFYRGLNAFLDWHE